MTTMPTDEDRDAAAGEWSVGDRVTARTNDIKVRTGCRGTVVGFSSVGGHPLVDFAGSGLVLIRAEHLDRDGDAPPEAKPPGRSRSSGTTRLSATPRPPAVAAAPPPPLPDWFDLPPPPRAEENHASASDPLHEQSAPSGLPSPRQRNTNGSEADPSSRGPARYRVP